MALVEEIDYGTPAAKADRTVSHHRRRQAGHRCRKARLSCARPAEAGIEIPKLCASDMVNAFGSCRLCLIEVEGRGGTPASCTTPVAEGMVVSTQTDRLRQIRRGVMELYMSDHPAGLPGLRRPASARCSDMAEKVGLRGIRYGRDGRQPRLRDAGRRGQSALHAPRTSRTRTSPTIRPSASSARCACAPARRCRAPSR